jgi:hypothetical protein
MVSPPYRAPHPSQSWILQSIEIRAAIQPHSPHRLTWGHPSRHLCWGRSNAYPIEILTSLMPLAGTVS